MMFTLSQLCVFLLMADAAFVCYGLWKKRIMWKWIVLYWAILTVKNIFDLLKI